MHHFNDYRRDTVEFDPINTLSFYNGFVFIFTIIFAITNPAPKFTFSFISASPMYDKCLDFEFFPIFDDFISTKFPITTFSSVEEDSLINEKGPISLFSPIKNPK